MVPGHRVGTRWEKISFYSGRTPMPGKGANPAGGRAGGCPSPARLHSHSGVATLGEGSEGPKAAQEGRTS